MFCRSVSVALIVGLLVISPVVHAVDLYWDTNGGTGGVGGTGTWENGQGNWSTNSAGTSPTTWSNATPPADLARFQGTPGTVTVSGTVNATGLRFDAGGYTLQGSPILTNLDNGIQYVTGTGNTVLSNDMVRYRANSSSAQTLNITNSGSGTLEISGNFSYVGGTGTVTGTSRTDFFATTADSVVIMNGSLTGSGFVSGGVLRTQGSGTVILNNDNTGFASVRPKSGTLLLGNNLALGASGGAFGDSADNAVPLIRMLTNDAITIGNPISFQGDATLTTRVLGGNTADISAFNGNLTFATAGSGMTPVLTAAAGGRVNFTGAMTNNPGLAIQIGENSSATGIVAFDRAAGIAATRGVSVNFGTLLILSATGATSNTGSGAVAVASGATLGGTGRATGLVTASAAASRFSPGDIDSGGFSQIGALRLHGGLTASSGATFAIDIDENSVDTIDFGSAPLSLAGTVTFDFTDLGDVNLGSPYTLFAGSGTWSGSPTFVLNAPTSYMLDASYGTGGYIWNAAGNQLSVQFLAVPEPASLAVVLIGGIGGLLVVARRKHGKKQSEAQVI